MKRSSICILLSLLLSLKASSQALIAPPPPPNINAPGLGIDSVVRYLQVTLTAADSGEGGRATQVANFSRIWKDRVTYNDNSGVNMFEQYLKTAQTAAQARSGSNNCTTGAFKGNWKNDGPDSFPTQSLGRMRDVWANPKNPDSLLASGDGGVWKSTNGGLTWTCITNNTSFVNGIVSPHTLAVNPNNTNNIYVGSYTYPNHVIWPQGLMYLNNNGITNNYNYGHGILVTEDGGSTWHQEFLPLNNPPLISDSLSGAGLSLHPMGKKYMLSGEKNFFTSLLAARFGKNHPFPAY